MSNRALGVVDVMVVAIVVIALAGSIAAGEQAATGTPEEYSPPRTPEGQPDIQGVWHGGGLTIEPGYDGNRGTGWYQDFFPTDATARETRASSDRRPPVASVPPDDRFVIGGGAETPDRRIPYQPWARERKEANFAAIYEGGKTLEYYDPVARCLPTGVPRAAYVGIGGYQVFQPPGYVIIFGEWNHQYRVIPLDGRPHVGPRIRLWNGDSRGRWEGNTLIVETTNLTDRTWLDHMGSIHSEALRVVERYTPVDADTLRYEMRLEDEKAFVQPWTLTLFLRRGSPGEELLEYACHEGNARSMESYATSK